ncbi:MAG: response regulator [Deltaproteobacteria bacterium]|nr:response regulator [Deltaproteobacteria bacterium]
MGKPLRMLIVEDVEADALLVVRELTRGGFAVTYDRVDDAPAMSAALDRQAWDVVVSDYSMPRFSAPAALALVRERNLDIPFIIVSGTVGEETAVDAMRAGAHDIMSKGRFARLVPAIERELRDAGLRAERTRMHEQLLVSDRMASVGTLAAGVAHEINNPLAALIANLDITVAAVSRLTDEARRACLDGAGGAAATAYQSMAQLLREVDEPLRDAREAADRVRLIVRDLKVFSRADEEHRGAVDVRRVLESTLRMATNEIRHRAQLVKDFGDVPPVEGNEARLGQVFLNLVVNAAQAIPEGHAHSNEIRVVTRPDGHGHVVVEVRDTGAGMAEAVLPRIFDPFFSTKPMGVGTGLGLAISHRIVTGLGGRIEVESRVGKGTVVRTILPVARGAPAEGPAPVASTPPGRRGRILVVDDERALATAIRRMLAPDHDVETVIRARDAMDLVARGERFDMVLCDLLMPEMTGMDLHAEWTRTAPGHAESLVFMTGGAFTPRAREFLNRVSNPRLEKPFDAAQLRALVHGLLR